MIQNRFNGGLNIPNIFIYSESLKYQWIKKLLDDDYKGGWKYFVTERMKSYGNKLIWECNLSFKDSNTVDLKNIFWENILHSWSKVNSK
jgi:hypothetical protein